VSASPQVDAVTVTANPAVDQTVWVPGFRAGEVNRVVREEITPGGKGVNVAAFLDQFGVPVLATGFLGTPNAGLFEHFLDDRGIAHAFVPVDGTTRTGVKIVDDQAGTTTDLNFPGFTISEAHVAALEAALADAIVPGRWVVLAGSLPQGAPPDTWRRLSARARALGARVALDTSGTALKEAIADGAALVKPNREELQELTGRELPDREALAAAADELVAAGCDTVVVSLGGDGAMFVRGGETVFATPPRVKVASTVGAGDAMVAGTVAGSLRGLPLAEVAALATAFSAVKISRVGPHLDANAVQETARAVAVEVLR
jgi:1-phosphofructokinase